MSNDKFSSVDTLNYLLTKIDTLFHTQNYITAALESAQKRSKMIGILGREGMGKSSAVAKYLYEHDHVYYVRIGQSYRVKNFLDEMIFQVSGTYPSHDSLFNKTKLLSGLLTKDNTKKIIIVDDAGKLSPRGLGFFHELRDNSIYCTSFVFIGLPYFQKHLVSAKKLGVTGVAEFYRRIESWYTVPNLKLVEIISYGKAHGLSDEQCQEIKNCGIETIAELENLMLKLVEASESGVLKNEKSKQIFDQELKHEQGNDERLEKARKKEKKKATTLSSSP